jgi:hypothetical protein
MICPVGRVVVFARRLLTKVLGGAVGFFRKEKYHINIRTLPINWSFLTSENYLT